MNVKKERTHTNMLLILVRNVRKNKRVHVKCVTMIRVYTCTNDKTNLRKVEVATQQHSIWPKQMKVVPDIPFKISHEEMTREVIWQLIIVKIGPNHR